jgi:hypothetical protein
MLRVSRKGSQVCVETMGGIVKWDAECGGQICEFAVKDDLFTHALLPSRRVLPGLEFIANGKRVALSSAKASLKITLKAADYVRLTAEAELLRGAIKVVQEYELHETGVLFCNFAIEVPAGKKVELGGCSANLSIDTRGTQHGLWGYYTRQIVYKRDYASIHPYTKTSVRHPLTDSADARELFPLMALDLGWEGTRFCSNHVEFLLEDACAFDDGDRDQTRTQAEVRKGIWEASWHFTEGRTLSLNGPRRYRNRWGLLFGRARTQRGPEADPAVRNNALGCRLCHVKYPYARTGEDWPWISMPIKQIAEQTSQVFIGNPPITRADEAAKAGADTVILHQFWMRHPGTNNEPPSDYTPFDPKWLKAFTARCHKHGMRVMYYIRGTEQWLQYASFFEDYLKKDFDGMYADWNAPFFMGYVKTSPLHLSLHNYFHFTRSLRQRVGEQGLLIGHTNGSNQLTLAHFDVALSGETSVRHDELLVNPSMTAYYAGLSFVGGNLISGNLPDRKAFASSKAMALCAALGMGSHPALEPGLDFGRCATYMRPLWDSMKAMPGQINRMHNPVYAPTRAVSCEAQNLYPCLWQSDKHKALLVVTNMGAGAESGAVELNLREMDVPRKAVLKGTSVAGTHPVEIDGSTVKISNIPPETIATVLIG